MPRNGSPPDDQQDEIFANAVELCRERAKALYLHQVRENVLKLISHAFEEGFEAAMEFCASDEIMDSDGSALTHK